MRRRPWLVFLFLLLSSCSSLISKKEIVSIDSYPRGAKVYDLDNQLLGVTPFFRKIPKDKERKFIFVYEENNQILRKSSVPKNNKCGMVWTDPLIEKIPLLKTLIPDFVKNFESELNPFHQIDRIRGGRLECSTYARDVALNLELEEDKCRTYIVMPPRHPIDKVSEEIVNQWHEKVFKNNAKSCDKHIDPRVAKVYLDFLGLDHMNRYYGKRYLPIAVGSKIGYKFGATHIVYLNYKENEHSFDVIPEVYDLHLNLRNAKKMEQSFHSEIHFKRKNIILDRLYSAFQLIPNTVSLKTKIRQNIYLEPEANEGMYSTRIHNLSFPPSIRLSYIEYPHQDWLLNFRFGPSFGYRKFETDYNLKFLDMVMAMKLFFSTPIGTIMGRVGYGGSYINASSNSSGYTQEKMVSMFQYGVEFYKFISERFFLNLGYRRNNFRENQIKDSNFNLDGYSQFFFNIGYYTPEFKLKIRELLFK